MVGTGNRDPCSFCWRLAWSRRICKNAYKGVANTLLLPEYRSLVVFPNVWRLKCHRGSRAGLNWIVSPSGGPEELSLSGGLLTHRVCFSPSRRIGVSTQKNSTCLLDHFLWGLHGLFGAYQPFNSNHYLHKKAGSHDTIRKILHFASSGIRVLGEKI